jgi:nucleoside-diphosphate-sugar epimerase
MSRIEQRGARILVTGGSGFIGVNLMTGLRNAGYQAFNVDVARPPVAEHLDTWLQCDILDPTALNAAFAQVGPDAVIHLAARTDTFGQTLDDYAVNTIGSRHVVEACSNHPGIRRLVLTSSQFVFGPFGLPRHDEDFRPHTVYGESKVRTEKHLREAGFDGCWTIIRPTNIWGPWHPRYPKEFWRVLNRGLYFHPKGRIVIRSYGYVGTVVDQILEILRLPEERVNHRVLYVGDPPVSLIDWVDGFSVALTGHPARQVPAALLRAIALAGDGVQLVTGRGAPLTSSRFRSMTESYPTPMEPTFALLGPPRYTLEDGVKTTVAWLRANVPDFAPPG